MGRLPALTKPMISATLCFFSSFSGTSLIVPYLTFVIIICCEGGAAAPPSALLLAAASLAAAEVVDCLQPIIGRLCLFAIDWLRVEVL